MSKKTELIKAFKDYKTRYEAVQAKRGEIDKSTLYTPEGRADAIEKLLADFAPTVQMYHDKAVEIIDTGLVALAEKWKKSSTGKLMDSGYQAGLSNVIKMLELGTVQGRDDLQNIIDTYAGDFNALAVIKKVLENSGNKVLQDVLMPEDNREKNKQLLTQLRGNIDRNISNETLKSFSKEWNAFNQGFVDVSVSMDSMAEFVETRLADDLELLD